MRVFAIKMGMERKKGPPSSERKPLHLSDDTVAQGDTS
jgi:hypothetical protein